MIRHDVCDFRSSRTVPAFFQRAYKSIVPPQCVKNSSTQENPWIILMKSHPIFKFQILQQKPLKHHFQRHPLSSFQKKKTIVRAFSFNFFCIIVVKFPGNKTNQNFISDERMHPNQIYLNLLKSISQTSSRSIRNHTFYHIILFINIWIAFLILRSF